MGVTCHRRYKYPPGLLGEWSPPESFVDALWKNNDETVFYSSDVYSISVMMFEAITYIPYIVLLREVTGYSAEIDGSLFMVKRVT